MTGVREDRIFRVDLPVSLSHSASGIPATFRLRQHSLRLLVPFSCCAVLSCSDMSNSLWPHGLQPTRLLCPWKFSRQEYWSGLPFVRQEHKARLALSDASALQDLGWIALLRRSRKCAALIQQGSHTYQSHLRQGPCCYEGSIRGRWYRRRRQKDLNSAQSLMVPSAGL